MTAANGGAPGVDLYVRDGCPVGVRCEACGAEARGLTVVTAAVALGVLCLTVCRMCADGVAGGCVPVSVGTAERLVAQHCAHLGIQVAAMAAVLAAPARPRAEHGR